MAPLVPDGTGGCICPPTTVQLAVIGGGCVSLAILLPSIILPLFLLVGIGAALLNQRRIAQVRKVPPFHLMDVAA